MKSRNKFLIILLILALSFCLALISSASEYDFISSYDSSAIYEPDDYGSFNLKEVTFSNSETSLTLKMFVLESYGPEVPNAWTCYLIQPYAFKEFVNFFVGHDDCSYDEFILEVLVYVESNFVDGSFIGDYFFQDWKTGYLNDSFLTKSFYNKLYYYNDELTYSEGFADGVTEGIKQSHETVDNFLSENGILYEPLGPDGTLDTLKFHISNNVLNALNLKYENGYHTGYRDAEDEVYPLAFADGVNASLTRLEDWLSGKNILYQTFEKDGDVATVSQYLNNNVNPAFDYWLNFGYEGGYSNGVDFGRVELFNEFVTEINRIYGTEYSLINNVSNSKDLAVIQTIFDIAYEKGEIYQLNKFNDDGGISDFLADISGTVLSTFFYLGTNISFMGTTALSLISLFVIAALAIFILKFFIK